MEYKLIEFIKNNPVLYEKQYRTIKYLDEKKAKWQEIGRILRKDPATVRQKWKHLRDTYLRSYKQKMKKGDDGDVLSTRTWQYYNAMSNVIFKTEENYDDETEAAITNLNQTEGEVQQFDVSIYQEQELSNEADFEIENFDLNDYVKKIDQPTTQNTNTSNTANTANTTSSGGSSNYVHSYRPDNELNKKKKYDKEALIQEACSEMTSLLQNAKKHFTPPSSNQVFFNSLALQVEEANLPALTQMRLQQRILEMVTLEIVNHQQSNNIQQL
ncbi:hypothetical protein FF38_02539 [Lucilia cuprina]|uniref:MADF domain-containing protein n=1 Tax=Lucilia cuprina TaxID=7375 RepID=A0A0L0BZ78_LUCCU|nr:hypothetical protein FF38_02539 [Lucilia cuprina]